MVKRFDNKDRMTECWEITNYKLALTHTFRKTIHHYNTASYSVLRAYCLSVLTPDTPPDPVNRSWD